MIQVLTFIIGGAAAFFILTLANRVAKQVHGSPRFLFRFFWPYWIGEARRFTHHDKSRWRRIGLLNAAVIGVIAGMFITHQLAGKLPWPSHHFNGWEISWLGMKAWWITCAHGHHTAVLWLVRWIVFSTALNFYTALFMSWENCGRELLGAFRISGMVKNGGKVIMSAPYTYILKAAELFNIENVFKNRDALQRKSGIYLIGIGNAPPSSLVIIASKKGLPKHFRFGDLPKPTSRLRTAIGLSPIPTWWDWQKKRHTGIAGNTGDGKSNIARALCAATNVADPNSVNIFIDIEGVDWRLPSLRNCIHVTEIDDLERVMNLIEIERQNRVKLCAQAQSGHHGVTDVLDLENSKLWKNPIKVTRIYIYFEEFDTTHDLYPKAKKAFDLFSSFVKRGRKYGISTIAITTRPDFETFKSARDQFRWIGVGNFRARAGAMIFEEDIRGWNEIGSFKYELESPFEGLGISMAPEVPLHGANDSLAAILTHTSNQASEACLKLGDWFNIQRHRVQHDEELEKVHESVEKYLSVPR